MKLRELAVGLLLSGLVAQAQLPPLRSTYYDGTASAGMQFVSGVYAPNLDMTVEAWVYRDDATRCETIVAQDFTRSFWFGFCGNTLRFYRNGNKIIDAGRNVTAERWTHVAVVYDGTAQQARFYIDGALISTQASTATNAPLSLPIHLGRTAASGGIFLSSYPFQGALDEVRVWSVARTRDEINSLRFIGIAETNMPAGLVAVFPAGGDLELRDGLAPTSQAGATKQVFGILPRDLVIPRRPLLDPLDGNVGGPEYQGSEMMAVRYLQGTNEVDIPARLNAYGLPPGRDPDIYIGLVGARPAGDMGFENRAEFTFAFGTPDLNVPNSNDRRHSVYYHDAPSRAFIGNGATWVSNSFDTVEAIKDFCEGEFTPVCIEMRDTHSSPGQRVMMLEMMIPDKLPIFNRRFYAPFDALPNNPQTWPRVTIGDRIGAAQTVTINVAVQENVAGRAPFPLSTYVRVVHGTTLQEIGRVLTSAAGTATFNLTVLTNTPLVLQLDAPDYWPRVAARGVPGTGTMPVSTTSASVRFEGCTGGGCDYADVVFDTFSVPEQRSGPTSVSPTTGNGWVLLREGASPKHVPPSSISVFGTNLHARISLYLTQCDRIVFNDAAGTPGGASGCNESNFLPIGGTFNEARTAIDAVLNLTNILSGTYRILMHDPIFRPSRRQWQYVPGSVTLGQPEYPQIWGWVFDNERDGTQYDEFSGVFQWNAYDCLIPPGFVISPQQTCIGCRIPNPLYFTWYAVFTGWTEAMTGSCLGMCATSRLFQQGVLREEDFDSNVHYPFGFRGISGDPENPLDESRPPKPQEHRFRVCDYSEPVNLWAHIHRNQAVQTSAEFLSSIISQMYGTGIGTTSYSIAGSPNSVLGDLRIGLTSELLCFQNGGDVIQSHCVVPYRIIDGFGLATNGFSIEPRAESTIVKVYDPNWPGRTDRFFEINRTRNEYRYLFGFRREGTNIVENWWSGMGVYSTSINIWRTARTMPGIDLLGSIGTLVFFGSADGTYAEPGGGRWGWDAAGVLHRDYPDAKVWAPSTTAPNFTPANQSRTVMFFPPPERKPTAVEINVRGKTWGFHAAEAGIITQLEVNEAATGDADTLNLTRRPDSNLSGLRYKPQRRMVSFKPTIGMNLGTNPAVVLSWEGISLPGGRAIEVVAKPELFGAQFVNDSTEVQRPVLRVLRSDTDGPKTNLFGPLEIPIDSLYSIALPQTGSDNLRAEIDRNRDGSPEESMIIFAQGVSGEIPSMTVASAGPGKIRISIPQGPDNWALEFTGTLAPGAPWRTESSTPQTVNGQFVYDLSTTDVARFFRLKKQ